MSEEISFSKTEREVLERLLMGHSNNEIAEDLCVTENAVRFHVTNILKKTGFNSRYKLLANYRHE